MTKSRSLKERTTQLKEEEKILLNDLDAKGGKVKRVLAWSLVAGILGVIAYSIYTSTTSTKSSKKRGKRKKTNAVSDGWWVDTLTEQLGPRLGNWILKEFQRGSGSNK